MNVKTWMGKLPGIKSKNIAVRILSWIGYSFGALVFLALISPTPPPSPTPSPSPTSTEQPAEVLGTTEPATEQEESEKTDYSVLVTHVVDGDTITIEGGQVIRYIGIDTPETVSPSKPVQCYGKEASQKNRELVDGKRVTLEKDVSETDRYKRLLRYVYIDGQMVNKILVAEGYAHASSYPPDVKFQQEFTDLQKQAREQSLGLWGSVCDTEPTPTPKIVIPAKPKSTPNTMYETPPPLAPVVGGTYACDCQKTCGQMSSCAEAQYQLNTCGCGARDADKDGIACDSDCQ